MLIYTDEISFAELIPYNEPCLKDAFSGLIFYKSDFHF